MVSNSPGFAPNSGYFRHRGEPEQNPGSRSKIRATEWSTRRTNLWNNFTFILNAFSKCEMSAHDRRFYAPKQDENRGGRARPSTTRARAGKKRTALCRKELGSLTPKEFIDLHRYSARSVLHPVFLAVFHRRFKSYSGVSTVLALCVQRDVHLRRRLLPLCDATEYSA